MSHHTQVTLLQTREYRHSLSLSITGHSHHLHADSVCILVHGRSRRVCWRSAGRPTRLCHAFVIGPALGKSGARAIGSHASKLVVSANYLPAQKNAKRQTACLRVTMVRRLSNHPDEVIVAFLLFLLSSIFCGRSCVGSECVLGIVALLLCALLAFHHSHHRTTTTLLVDILF